MYENNPTIICLQCLNPFVGSSSKQNTKFCSRSCYLLYKRDIIEDDALYGKRTIERFWSYVDKDNHCGCWLWIGKKYPNGYGSFVSFGRTLLAHRVSYEIQYGPIPDGMHVLHIPPCINRHCVSHLYLGTRKQNMADALAMGRFAIGDRSGARLHPDKVRRGERHGLRLHPEAVARGEKIASAKLTHADIIAIRDAYSAGIYQKDIAIKYRVAQTTISKIIRRTRWNHIP